MYIRWYVLVLHWQNSPSRASLIIEQRNAVALQ